MTALHCEIGNHMWFRDPQTGRPPKNCPEHMPEKQEIKVTVKHETGPKTLSELIPGIDELLEQESMRTLHCEAGHDWQAPRRRGRAPRYCPEHAQAFVKPISTAAPTRRMAEQLEELLSAPSAQLCNCGITPESTPAYIRMLNGGCTEPNFVCPTLVSIRNRLSL
jgi:hypothetical protein